jgi:hypothetical protein
LWLWIVVVEVVVCEKRRKAGPVGAARAVRSSVRTGAADSCLHAPMLGFLGGEEGRGRGEGGSQQQSSSSASLQRMQTLAREGEGEAEASERRAASEQQACSGKMGPPDADGPRNPVADPHGPGVGALWMGAARLGGARGFLCPGGPGAAAVGRVGGWWLVVGVLAWPGLLSCWLWTSPADCRGLDWATKV